MASIHGAAWMSIGVLMSIYAKFVLLTTGRTEVFLDLFFYVGILFLLIGIGKLGFSRIQKEQSKNVLTPKQPYHPAHVQSRHCPNCKQVISTNVRFCSLCGFRLF